MILLCATTELLAVMMTDRIAEQGKEVSREFADGCNWPDGALAFVNDPLRTTGWSVFFSELPNDVKYFAFSVRKSADVQHLIDAFAKIKSDKLLIRLAAENGPVDPFSKDRARMPGVEFSIGEQKTLDAWFKRLPEVEPGVRQFGVHRLKEPHSATPPTLTIYVENEHVSLDRLTIPRHVRLDTEFGLDQGGPRSWKWDEKTREWGPPPKEIVEFIERHRRQQANPGGGAAKH